jgi:hypothetical protein
MDGGIKRLLSADAIWFSAYERKGGLFRRKGALRFDDNGLRGDVNKVALNGWLLLATFVT